MSDDLEIEIEEETGKSSRMMLIVGTLIGLTVGVVGAFLWLSNKDEASSEEEEVVEEVVEPSEEEVAIPAVSYIYLYIERMPAALVDENGRTVGYVFLDITLELHDSEEQSYVSARMPRVKDALLRAISKNGLTRPGTSGQMDYDRVSSYLLEASNAAIEKEYVTGVYITRALRAPS
jgi:flagellar basal body-associated protein FliL